MPIRQRYLSRLALHRVLTVTLVISVLLHLFVFSEFSFQLPSEDERVVLQAELVNTPPPAKKEPPAPKKRIIKKSSAPRPAKKTIATPQPTIDRVATAENTAPIPSPGAALKSDEGSDGGSSTDTIEDSASDLAAPVPYSHVEMIYEVRRNGGSPAGTTRVTFDINTQNNTYSILSHTQAKGLASLFFGNLIQKSEGRVETTGLKPDFYLYQYGNDAKKQQTATFKWESHLLELQNAKGNSSETLIEGTQDFLSFMYQFMFTPPLDSMQITMTNGKRLRRYDYSFEGEEIINSALGQLNTIHLLKTSGDEDKTEIWLATDYRYLPVKIVKTEKDGTVIEQLASQLNTTP